MRAILMPLYPPLFIRFTQNGGPSILYQKWRYMKMVNLVMAIKILYRLAIGVFATRFGLKYIKDGYKRLYKAM